MQSAAQRELGRSRDVHRPHIVTNMEPGVCYFVGPGTTMRCVVDLFGIENTLLGDGVLNKELVGSDLNEAGLLVNCLMK